MSKKIAVVAGCIVSSMMLLSTNVLADNLTTYKITLTNITPGQPIAPIMVATHRAGMSFFQVGETPPAELANLAEAGDGHPMADKLSTMKGVTEASVGTTGTPPGGSSSVVITANEGDHLSLGAMLGNTNDAFVALTDVQLPSGKHAKRYMAPAYDAGTETNDELCATVPGPACGGEALSPSDSGEGFVSIHNGIHGIGGLSAAELDWRNPVAKIVIERMK